MSCWAMPAGPFSRTTLPQEACFPDTAEMVIDWPIQQELGDEACINTCTAVPKKSSGSSKAGSGGCSRHAPLWLMQDLRVWNNLRRSHPMDIIGRGDRPHDNVRSTSLRFVWESNPHPTEG
jgi:hypothetical protein